MSGIWWFTSLLLTDKEFVEKYAEHLDITIIPRGPMQQLIAHALDVWDEDGCLLSRQSIKALTGDQDEEDVDDMLAVFDKALADYGYEEEVLPTIRRQAEEWLRKRIIGYAMEQAQGALKRGDADLAELELQDIEDPRVEKEVPIIFEDLDLGKRLAPQLDTEDAVPLGILDIDQYLDGGMHPEELGVLMAATNVGKSMVLAHMAATAWLHDNRVLFLTYELTPVQIAKRICASITEYPITQLPEGAGVWLYGLRRNAGLENSALIVREGVDNMGALKRLIAEHQPSVVFLDSADDMLGANIKRSTYEELGLIYSQLRKLARSEHIVVWTSTQSTRDAVDKAHISLRQVADCFHKARRCHIMVGLAQGENERKYPQPRMNIYILKDSQHGQRGRSLRAKVKFGHGRMGYPHFAPAPAAEKDDPWEEEAGDE